MNLQLGEKIKELRKRDGRTQEDLAKALDITCQAVSRWEMNGSYPDMELIPAIANYFGISIDELFGYECERDKKVNEIIARINDLHITARSDSEWVDDSIFSLREGLAEFPCNEKLLMCLADTLSEAGWRKYGERLYYNDEGYQVHDSGSHRKNEYWAEAIKICENLIEITHDSGIFTNAVRILVLLYRNIGEYEKGVNLAKRMPEISQSREIMMTYSSDEKKRAEYTGRALLALAAEFAQQLIQGLMVNLDNFKSDMPIKKIEGAINLFSLICDDGNYGEYNGKLIQLYLYLSRVQWERGYHDEAFSSLDKALNHAKMLESLLDGKEHYFTAPLISLVKCKSGEFTNIAASLPDDWPFWCCPDYSKVDKEIKSDPRWDKWVEKTKG